MVHHPKRELTIKPGMGALLNYFSLYLNDMHTAKDIGNEIKDIYKHNNAVCESYYLFGAYDIMLLGISESTQLLDKIQQMKSYHNVKGVMDYYIHYGTILDCYPHNFDFYEAMQKNALIGIITVKIRSAAWKRIFKVTGNIEKLSDKFSVLFHNAIENTNSKCPLNTSDYRAILLMSNGCEDGIIIFFTNSLQYIKRFVTNIRTLELIDLIPHISNKKSNIKHIIVSTNTIMGVNMDLRRLMINIPTESNIYDKINWLSLFEIRPGHLQNAINSIKMKYGRKLNISPMIGRNDLMVSSGKKKEYNLKGFLYNHFGLIKSLLGNNSFLSSETYISFPKLFRVESEDKPQKINDDTLDNKRFENRLKKLISAIDKCTNIHILEKESFIQIVRKLLYLIQNRYLKDTFITLAPIVLLGINEYLKLKPSERAQYEDIDLWTGLIELCFATRYQGSPPIGETAVYSTLGFYTSGQKVLTLLDLISNRIARSIIEESKKLSNKLKAVTIYVITTNTNCVSASKCLIFPIPIAFILLPPRPLFHPEILMYTFFHELGHNIFDCFFIPSDLNAEIKKHIDSLDSHNRKELKQEVEKLEEVMAELFSVKVLSNLDFKKHQEKTMDMLKLYKYSKYLERDFRRQKKEDMEIANYCFKEKGSNNFRTALEKYFPKLSRLNNSLYIEEYIKLITVWNDDIISKIRKVASYDNSQENFWNLWIYLYPIMDKCYLPNL